MLKYRACRSFERNANRHTLTNEKNQHYIVSEVKAISKAHAVNNLIVNYFPTLIVVAISNPRGSMWSEVENA